MSSRSGNPGSVSDPFSCRLQVLLALQGCLATLALHSGQGWCALWSEGVDTEEKGVCVMTMSLQLFFFFLQREKQLYNLVLVHIKRREIASTCPSFPTAAPLDSPALKSNCKSEGLQLSFPSLLSTLWTSQAQGGAQNASYVSTSMHHLLADTPPPHPPLHRCGPFHLRHGSTDCVGHTVQSLKRHKRAGGDGRFIKEARFNLQFY